MIRIQTSSMIGGYLYKQADQQLVVEFKDGSQYVYFNVDAGVYQGLVNSESKGKYFLENIRDNFESQKLVPSDKKISEVVGSWPFPVGERP